MSGDSIQQFEQVVRKCLSENNAERELAEKTYGIFKKSNPNVRSLSSVLLRKCLTWVGETSCYEDISVDVKNLLKNSLLKILINEKVVNVRKKLTYCVSNFIASMFEKKEKDETHLKYMQQILLWGKGDNLVLLECSLNCIQYLCTFLDEKMELFLSDMKQILSRTLQHSKTEIREIGLKTACALISTSISKNQRKQFQPVVPLMLKVLAFSLNQRNFEAAKTCVECFIEIAIEEPSFFSENPARVIFAMYQIAKTETVDEELRHISMEFIVTLSETSPSIIKTVPKFIENIFPLCLHFMSSITFDLNKFNETYLDDSDEITHYDVGIESLDRIAKALGGKIIQPFAFKIIPRFVNDKNVWKNRCIGLMAICQITEGCKAFFREHLNNIVDMALKLLVDDHPRVRYAAVQTLAQLSTDYKESFLKDFHKKVFPCIIKTLDDSSPKVKSHAGTSIINFIENSCDVIKYMGPFLDKLLYKLINGLLKSKVKYVQQQALAAITVIVVRSKTYFKKYYPHIIPLLKKILQSAHIVNDAILRSRAIECIGDLAVAVGKEVFSKDAADIINIFKHIESQKLKDDNPQPQYILSAWPKLAEVLYEDFVPLLAYVIPPLLNLLKQTADVVVSDIDDTNGTVEKSLKKISVSSKEKGYQTVVLTLRGVGEKRITVKTSVLEDQIFAISTLTKFSKCMKEHFFVWVQPVAKLVVPFLHNVALEEIKEESIALLPALLDNVITSVKKRKAPAKMIKQLFDFMFDGCMKSLGKTEENSNILIFSLIYMCIKKINGKCISNECIDKLVVASKHQILSSLLKRSESLQAKKIEDNQEKLTGIDEDVEDENEFLLVIQETFGQIMKYHPYFSVMFVKSMFKTFFKLLDPNGLPVDHRIGICIFVDLIEFGGGIALQFVDKLFPAFLNYTKSNYTDVRQPAVYGLGALAQYGGDKMNPLHCKQAIQALISVIQDGTAKEDVNASATCNAISALYKFIQYRSKVPGVNARQLLVIWVKNLPVTGDIEEAFIVHKHLVDLFLSNNEVIMGAKNHVLGIFAKLVKSDLVSEDDKKRIMEILKPYVKTQI